jgi:hypothetical protein
MIRLATAEASATDAAVEAVSIPRPEKNARCFYKLRDNLRKTLLARDFARHSARYTPITTLLSLYVSDHPEQPPPHETHFRSALGRIFNGPLAKLRDMVGIVSPLVPSIDPVAVRRAHKFAIGEKARAHARMASTVANLRDRRAEKRGELERAGPVDETPLRLNFRFVDEFLALGCVTDLLLAGLYPNGKEMAESMAAFSAVRDFMLFRKDAPDGAPRKFSENGPLHLNDPTVTLVAVGDGCTPRTAGLFAFRTSWRCVSVDPALRTAPDRPWAGIARLEECPDKVQDVRIDIAGTSSRVVVVAWHAHVSIRQALACLSFDGVPWDVTDVEMSRQLRSRVALVTCACCQYEPRQRVMPDMSTCDVEYEDEGVNSMKRTIRVWRFRDTSSFD